MADPGIFAYKEGFVANLTVPGLGVDINEAKVREMAEKGHRLTKTRLTADRTER